jgi:hypothetical protein
LAAPGLCAAQGPQQGQKQGQQRLRAADVRGVTLGDDAGGRLGWDAYLVDAPQTRDRRDVRYEIVPA